MDVLNELRGAGAVDAASPTTLASARAAIQREASALVHGPRRHERFQRRVVASVAAFALVGAGSTVAWTVIRQSDPRTTTTIECGVDSFIPEETGNPVTDCHDALARQGVRVPPLAGWVTPSGLVDVLPKGERPPAGSTLLASGFMVDAGVRYVTDSLGDAAGPLLAHCLTPAAATQWAEGQLVLAGLAGWSVRADAPTSASCGSYAAIVDASTTTVLLRSVTYVDPQSEPANAETRLISVLHAQMVAGPNASCLSTQTAQTLAARDAAQLGISSGAVTISDGGTVGTGEHCATPFVVPAGYVDVVIWQAPRA